MDKERNLNFLVVSGRCRLINLYGHSLRSLGNCYVTDKVKEVQKIIEKHPIELAIVDMSNNSNAINTIKELNKKHPKISSIAITEKNDIDGAVAALKAGASDLIMEPMNADEISDHYLSSFLASENDTDNLCLLPGMIHDLNNSVCKIISYSNILKNQINQADSDSIQNLLLRFIDTCRVTNLMLVEMLKWTNNFSKLQKFTTTPLDCLKLIKDIIYQFEPALMEKQINLLCDFPDNVSIVADEYMLTFILRNLIDNAIKYSKKHDKIEITVIEQNKRTFLIVSDTGAGIDKETLDAINQGEILNSFHGKTQKNGSGLALQICKQYLKKHDSELHIVTETGKGSCFYFYLDSDIVA